MKGDIPQAIWCINVAEVHSMKTLVKMKTLFKWLGIVIVVLVMAVGLLFAFFTFGARTHQQRTSPPDDGPRSYTVFNSSDLERLARLRQQIHSTIVVVKPVASPMASQDEASRGRRVKSWRAIYGW